MKIKVNGIELNYEMIGEGKEVILLNPNSVHTKLFMNPIVKLFAQDYHSLSQKCLLNYYIQLI